MELRNLFPNYSQKDKNARNFVPTRPNLTRTKKNTYSRGINALLCRNVRPGATCCAEGILVAKRQFFFGVFEQLESLLRYEFYVGFVNCILSFSYSNRLYEIAPRLTL